MLEKVYTWTMYGLHLISMGYIMDFIYGWKFQGKYKFLQRTATWAAAFLTIFLIRFLFPEASWSRTAVTIMVVSLYLILPFGGSLKARIMLTLVTNVVSYMIELLAYVLLGLIGITAETYWNDAQNTQTYYAASLYYMLFYIAIMFVVWGYYSRKRFVKEQLLFFAIPCFQLLQLIIFLFIDTKSEIYLMLLGLLIVSFDIYLDCGVIRFLSDMQKRFEAEEKLTALYNQRQYEQEYYRSMQRHIEEIRRIRHDYLNQIQTVYLLLEGEITEQQLSEYRERHLLQAGKLWRKQEGQKKGIYSDNPVLDAILVLKKVAAEKQGIVMEIVCDMAKESKLNEAEICSLFGNLLDNAIEACEKVERGERKIYLWVLEKEDQLTVRCCNSFEPSKVGKGGIWASHKAEKDAHGIGLKVIEKICNDYNGHMRKTVRGRTVSVEVNI